MDLLAALKELIEAEHLSQAELAERAGVSLATVSRALRHAPKRRSAAQAKLVRFMQKRGAISTDAGTPLTDAIRETWDGSHEHAAALARLILATRDLRPPPRKETSQ
jgi:transcriptional regulator with XRE-family HTH domain